MLTLLSRRLPSSLGLPNLALGRIPTTATAAAAPAIFTRVLLYFHSPIDLSLIFYSYSYYFLSSAARVFPRR